ncbi:MAG: hypothetical protein JXP48_04285 [Acidobacteria bacterium]|nr:hypothetical protein [Acidobacteriota bacterium]
MSGLNENQKRRITATFKYADDLLSESLSAVAPLRSRLYPRCVGDLSPDELRVIEKLIGEIRGGMASLLREFGVASLPPATSATWVLKTCLSTLWIVFEELRPDRMRGYGELDPEAGERLERNLRGIRELLDRLSATLGETKGESGD